MRLLLILGSMVSLAAQETSVSLRLATGQTTAPVTVVSVTASQDFLVDKVVVQNAGDRDVLAVAIGAAVLPSSGQRRSLGLIVGDPVRRPLAKGAASELYTHLVAYHDVKSTLAQRSASREKEVLLEVGVTRVLFSDGTIWSQDLKDNIFPPPSGTQQ